jgi:predicted porin
MKLKLSVVAVGLALCAGAHADGNVTVFGILDGGFMHASKTGPTGTGGAVTAFQDAPILPSIYGFKGTEDLGGGLKAGFELEGGFNLANGTHNSPGVYQSQIFGRVAEITLGGEWGKFGVGMQVDPGLIAAISTEPRGMTDSLSSLEHWIIGTVGNNNGTGFGSLGGGIFDQNALTYTYAANGVYLGVEYGVGGVAGSTSSGTTEALGATYTNSGFTVSGSFAKAECVTNATTCTSAHTSSQIDAFGLAYAMGPWAVRGQYGEYKSAYNNGGTALEDVKNWGVGFDFKTSDTNKLNAAYYRSKDSGAPAGGKTTELALLDIYSLSKRTSVYGQVASVKTDTNAGASAALGGIYTPVGLFASAGVTTTLFGFGMQHVF